MPMMSVFRMGKTHRQGRRFVPFPVMGGQHADHELQGPSATVQPQAATPDSDRGCYPLGPLGSPAVFPLGSCGVHPLEDSQGVTEDVCHGEKSPTSPGGSPTLPVPTAPTQPTAPPCGFLSSTERRVSDDWTDDDASTILYAEGDDDVLGESTVLYGEDEFAEGDDDVLDESRPAPVSKKTSDVANIQEQPDADEFLPVGDGPSDPARTSTPFSCVTLPAVTPLAITTVPGSPILSPPSLSLFNLSQTYLEPPILSPYSPSSADQTTSGLSPSSLPASSLSPSSLSPSSLPTSSLSPSSLPAFCQSPCHTPLASPYPVVTLSQLYWPVTGVIQPAPHLPAHSLPVPSPPASSLPVSSLPASSQSPCSLPASSQSPCSLPASSQSPCSLPAFGQSPCSLPASGQSPCSLPASSQSPCSLPASSQSPCSLPASSQSPCSLSASTQSPCSLNTPLVSPYPVATLSQLNWSVTGIIRPAPRHPVFGIQPGSSWSHLAPTCLPVTCQPQSRSLPLGFSTEEPTPASSQAVFSTEAPISDLAPISAQAPVSTQASVSIQAPVSSQAPVSAPVVDSPQHSWTASNKSVLGEPRRLVSTIKRLTSRHMKGIPLSSLKPPRKPLPTRPSPTSSQMTALRAEFAKNMYVREKRHHVLAESLNLPAQYIKDAFRVWRSEYFQQLRSQGKEVLIKDIRRASYETLNDYQIPQLYHPRRISKLDASMPAAASQPATAEPLTGADRSSTQPPVIQHGDPSADAQSSCQSPPVPHGVQPICQSPVIKSGIDTDCKKYCQCSADGSGCQSSAIKAGCQSPVIHPCCQSPDFLLNCPTSVAKPNQPSGCNQYVGSSANSKVKVYRPVPVNLQMFMSYTQNVQLQQGKAQPRSYQNWLVAENTEQLQKNTHQPQQSSQQKPQHSPYRNWLVTECPQDMPKDLSQNMPQDMLSSDNSSLIDTPQNSPYRNWLVTDCPQSQDVSSSDSRSPSQIPRDSPYRNWLVAE